MRLEDLDYELYTKKGDYGIFPAPVSDREFVDYIIKHFLPGYYSVNPISREQFNAECLYRIIGAHQPKETFLDRLINKFIK